MSGIVPWRPPPPGTEKPVVVELVTPPTEVDLGPIKVDVLKAALGVGLGDILAGSVVAKRTEHGQVVHVIEVPRQQIIVPLPTIGPIKFACWRGVLHLSVPLTLSDMIRGRLSSRIKEHKAGFQIKADADGNPRGVFLIPPHPGEVLRYDVPGFGPVVLRFP